MLTLTFEAAGDARARRPRDHEVRSSVDFIASAEELRVGALRPIRTFVTLLAVADIDGGKVSRLPKLPILPMELMLRKLLRSTVDADSMTGEDVGVLLAALVREGALALPKPSFHLDDFFTGAKTGVGGAVDEDVGKGGGE